MISDLIVVEATFCDEGSAAVQAHSPALALIECGGVSWMDIMRLCGVLARPTTVRDAA